MLWKIYFWISVIVTALSVLGLLDNLLNWLILIGILFFLPKVVYALAVYSYTFKKNILSQRSWKSWFVIVLLLHALQWWSALETVNYNLNFLTILLIIGGIIIFPFPAWYCIYKLGFDKKERVKVAAVKTSK